eukprot:308338-Alexandrium_andersonii.AAC.1
MHVFARSDHCQLLPAQGAVPTPVGMTSASSACCAHERKARRTSRRRSRGSFAPLLCNDMRGREHKLPVG